MSGWEDKSRVVLHPSSFGVFVACVSYACSIPLYDSEKAFFQLTCDVRTLALVYSIAHPEHTHTHTGTLTLGSQKFSSHLVILSINRMLHECDRPLHGIISSSD